MRVALLALLCLASATAKKNVLYIISDDLRPEMAKAYGQEILKTPNLDTLASTGVTFTRAYCQQAVCGPSRNSFLSGRRPDKTKTYTFETSFRDVGADWQTMPQIFKENGYFTCGMGKTFHDDVFYSPPDYDLPYSWSSDCSYFVANINASGATCGPGTEQPTCARDECGNDGVASCSPFDDYADYEDSQVVANAKALLGEHASMQAGNNFFLMVGIRRPHLPWAIPADVIAAQPEPSEIPVATLMTKPPNTPEVAWYNGMNEPPFASAIPADSVMNSSYPLPVEVQQDLKRGYLASVAWVDHLIGDLLGELETLGLVDDTLVVLHGDHGWQLGERGVWSKETNFELAARVPLLMRAPWKKGSAGTTQDTIVELVDMYKTVVDLAELAPAGGVQDTVDGDSFAGLFSNSSNSSSSSSSSSSNADGVVADPEPQAAELQIAYSQYPRCLGEGYGGYINCMSAPEASASISYMGMSVRTPDWRYTGWYTWDQENLVPEWPEVWGEPSDLVELYSHQGDDGTDFNKFENENLAYEDSYKGLVANMTYLLEAHFRNDAN